VRRTETTTADALRRQARRCRWRRNAVTAQVVGYGTVATVLGSATMLLAVALRGSPRVFGAALAAALTGVLVVVAALGRHARRAWVRRRVTAAWVDDEAGLGGRLTTLLALDGRGGLLLPLLRADNERRRGAWAPERLVPTPFPPLALGALLAASTMFLALLGWAPSMAPTSGAAPTSGPASGEAADDMLGFVARRLFSSPGAPAPGGGAGSADASGASGEAGGEGSGDRLASLQARIRRQMWGERWARSTQAVAARVGGGTNAASRRTPTAARAGAGIVVPGGDGSGAVEPSTDGDAVARTDTSGGAGAGAGTDPQLFGDATDDAAGGGRFALGLTARVFGTRAGSERPSGPPPAADEDAHPLLATGSRPDEPFHAASVPPAYAPIVRAVFAHGAPE
jgi:hypothetical protein